MSQMFYGSSFNKGLAQWNVSNVRNMNQMFLIASTFNQDLGLWDTGSVTDMSFMFALTTASYNNDGSFKHNLTSWDITNVTNNNAFFRYANEFPITTFTDPKSPFYVSS